jgi:hypothetical protein
MVGFPPLTHDRAQTFYLGASTSWTVVLTVHFYTLPKMNFRNTVAFVRNSEIFIIFMDSNARLN